MRFVNTNLTSLNLFGKCPPSAIPSLRRTRSAFIRDDVGGSRSSLPSLNTPTRTHAHRRRPQKWSQQLDPAHRHTPKTLSPARQEEVCVFVRVCLWMRRGASSWILSLCSPDLLISHYYYYTNTHTQTHTTHRAANDCLNQPSAR